MTFESLNGKINVLEVVRQRVPGCGTGVGKYSLGSSFPVGHKMRNLVSAVDSSRYWGALVSKRRNTHDTWNVHWDCQRRCWYVMLICHVDMSAEMRCGRFPQLWEQDRTKCPPPWKTHIFRPKYPGAVRRRSPSYLRNEKRQIFGRHTTVFGARCAPLQFVYDVRYLAGTRYVPDDTEMVQIYFRWKLPHFKSWNRYNCIGNLTDFPAVERNWKSILDMTKLSSHEVDRFWDTV